MQLYNATLSFDVDYDYMNDLIPPLHFSFFIVWFVKSMTINNNIKILWKTNKIFEFSP